MGWFEEQIRQRKQNDQEAYEDAIFEMASAVLGKREAGILNDKRIVTQAAIDQVLKYYHFKPTEVPEKIKEPEERLEHYRTEMNRMLDACGFGPVYTGDPYECLLMMALSTPDPMETYVDVMRMARDQSGDEEE